MAMLRWEWLLWRLFQLFTSFSLIIMMYPLMSEALDVIYAVNCGGPRHTDRHGIKYSADSNRVGISSEFGKTLTISRVHPDDMILYQTERYHTTSFSYDIPIETEGEFILITKFAEVYFTHPGGKVCMFVSVSVKKNLQGWPVTHAASLHARHQRVHVHTNKASCAL